MNKALMFVVATTACVFTMAAKANQCDDFGFAIHNKLNEAVKVNYSILPEGTTIHNYPSGTQMEPQDNFFFTFVPANKYVHLEIKDSNDNIIYTADLKKKLAPSEAEWHGWHSGLTIDPPGAVSLSNVESKVKTVEEQIFNGSCAQNLSGRYTLALE